jgi:hypothetical protein
MARRNELKSFLNNIFSNPATPETVLFVDALDECGDLEGENSESKQARQIVFFFEQLLDHAITCGVPLTICISGRSSFNVGSLNHYEITLDQENRLDLELYIDTRLKRYITPTNSSWLPLKRQIVEKSAGIFLWTKLVIDRLLAGLDDGRTIAYMKTQLTLPPRLSEIFLEILTVPGLCDKDRRMTLKLLQWTVFSTRLFRLREWYVIMGLIQDEPFTSMRAWSESPECPTSEIELETRSGESPEA